MLKLIIEDDEGRKTVVPFVRDEITIGRQEGNTIRLTERNVSRRHGRLLRQSGQVLVEDLGSYNGIRVNGDRITGQVHIKDGDLIQIGDYDLAIQREDEVLNSATMPLEAVPTRQVPKTNDRAAAETVPALPIVRAPSTPAITADDESEDTARPRESRDSRDALGGDDDAGVPKHQSTAVIRIDKVQHTKRGPVVDLDSSESPRIVVLNTELAGREFVVARSEVRVGRVDDNDIAIDHRSLSRTHCKLVRENDGEWHVVDMQSANGLRVNGEPYAKVALRSQDIIELGHVKVRFVAAGDVAEATPVLQVPMSSASDVRTSEIERPSSKAPVVAIVVSLLVILAGGGGYVWWKSQNTAATPPKPPSANKPGDELATEAAQQQAAAVMTVARRSLDMLDVSAAETSLRGCKIGNTPCPQAVQLLGQLDGERGFATALLDAKEALERNEANAARAHLDTAKGTQLFKAQAADLEGRYAKVIEKKLAEQQAAKPPPAPAPEAPKPPAKPTDIERIQEEAKPLIAAKNYDAARIRLEKCLALDPNHLWCLRSLASSLARIGSRDSNSAETERARGLYKRYVDIAPADDEFVPKIKNILNAGQ